ncbi:MAG: AbiV family abortive infection protein [Parafilimonas sp.]
MKNEKYIKFNEFRLLCLKNAEDAIKGAEVLIDRNINHIVFHLCVLGLEEIGKIFMAWIKLSQVENWDKGSMKIELDDHEKKIFYAIWGPSIGKEIIDKNQLDKNHVTASKLHSLRLFYLYGSMDDIVESSKKIQNEEAQNIYRFAKSRFEFAQVEGEVKEDVDEGTDSFHTWFAEFLKIPGKENYVFGKISQEKLIELNDVNEWIKWLKETREKEQQELSPIAEKEINRKVEVNTKLNLKWEFSFTIFTPSHSIRNKDIAAINKFDRPFKFYLGRDRHTLIIKYQLPSIVTVHDLWQQGWLTSKLFVAGLNIASNGLFYWHAPKDIDKYYDSLLDIESGKKLVVSLSPQLTLNWEEKRMFLSVQQFHLAFIVYEYFINIRNREDFNLITDYMAALAMFARTDIHLRMEVNAFMLFFKVFQQSILKHETFNENQNVFEIGFQQIFGMLTNRNEYDRIIKLAESIKEGKTLSEQTTLKEVVAMKNYCAIYLLTISVRIMQNKPGIRLVPDNSELQTEELKNERRRYVMNENLYPALVEYIFNYRSSLMNDAEQKAYRHQIAVDRIAHGDRIGFHKYQFEEEHVSKDESVLRLLEQGYEYYKTMTATRIYNEHKDELNLNLCPKCFKIARTPEAKQCRFCLHDWH